MFKVLKTPCNFAHREEKKKRCHERAVNFMSPGQQSEYF